MNILSEINYYLINTGMGLIKLDEDDLRNWGRKINVKMSIH